jgi:hypothetical protein
MSSSSKNTVTSHADTTITSTATAPLSLPENWAYMDVIPQGTLNNLAQQYGPGSQYSPELGNAMFYQALNRELQEMRTAAETAASQSGRWEAAATLVSLSGRMSRGVENGSGEKQ